MSDGIDLGRVKRNVAKMVSMNAPESEIDEYIAAEGTSIDAVKAYKSTVAATAPSEDKSLVIEALETPPGRALVGLGGGLTRAGIGVIQAVNDATGDKLGIKGKAKATVEESRTIEKKLGPIAKAAGVVGEYGPYVAAPAGGGSLLARSALGAVSGGAQGAASAEGAEDVDRTAEAKKGALIGAAAVPTVELASKAIKGTVKGGARTAADAVTGFSARSADDLAATSAAMKQQGTKAYQAARQAGAVIKQKSVGNLVAKLEQALSDTGISNADLHRNTLSVMKQIKATAKNKAGLSLEEADQYRQLISQVVSDNTDKLKGMNSDALKASRLLEAFDDAIEGVGRSDLAKGDGAAAKMWQGARQKWGEWRRFEAVAQVVQRADGDPKRLQAGLKRFMDNPKNTRGMTAAQKDGLKAAYKADGFDKALSWLGKFGIDPTNPNWASGSMAGLSGFLVSPVLPAAGSLAKVAEKYAVRGKAEKALRGLEVAR